MIVSVTFSNDTATACAYIGAASSAHVRKGLVHPLGKGCADAILIAHAPLDQWLPFGKQEQDESLLVTRDRKYMAVIQTWGVCIGNLEDLRSRVRRQYPEPASFTNLMRAVATVTNIVARMSAEDKNRFMDLDQAQKTELIRRYGSSQEWDQMKSAIGTMFADMLDGQTNSMTRDGAGRSKTSERVR